MYWLVGEPLTDFRAKFVVGALAIVLGACRQAPPRSTIAAPRQPLPALSVEDSLRPALLAVGRAALNDALDRAKDTAVVCIVFIGPDRREFRPEPADIRMLADSPDRRDVSRRFVSIGECPRTYTTMIRTVDARGNTVGPPPRGYVDPHILRIYVPERWLPKTDERSITVAVHVAQGTETDEYLCRVRPQSARVATLPAGGRTQRLADAATCRLYKQSFS